MKQFDFDTLEKDFFKRGNPIKKLLKVSLDLFEAKQTGVLYGTNKSKARFLPTSLWDRGIMDRFDGMGVTGLILKMFGTYIVAARKLSPVFFYKKDENGKTKDNDGIISYVLRNFSDYYKKGIRVIICPDTANIARQGAEEYIEIPFYSYNGNLIEKSERGIKLDARIVKHFNSSNSIYIYLPDYGILVLNTANTGLLETKESRFVNTEELIKRLDLLMKLVEKSSLAYLGHLKGKKGAQLLWRKEEHLRKTSHELIENEKNYRDLYENAPIAYISLNSKGDILKCNKMAEVLSGYGRDDLIERNAITLFFGQQGKNNNTTSILETLASGKDSKDMEFKMKPKNGESFWVSISIDSIIDSAGNIVEFRAVVMDISRRKSLEKQ